jgi:hypothetical protein
VGDEAERPAHQYEQAVLEADEVPQVDDQPNDPGEASAEPESLDIGHGAGVSDSSAVPADPLA